MTDKTAADKENADLNHRKQFWKKDFWTLKFEKVGVHDPPAPMVALTLRYLNCQTAKSWSNFVYNMSILLNVTRTDRLTRQLNNSANCKIIMCSLRFRRKCLNESPK